MSAGRGDQPDRIDRLLLDRIQSGFPLESRPYAVIGESLGISEGEALARVEALRASGHIRRVGANFDSRRLGFSSTLAFARVPREKLEQFVAAVNAYPEVTHNYLRSHPCNVWFTIVAGSMTAVEEIVADISRKTGVRVESLPATAVYKIRVDFPLEESDGS